jgi:hypothetical protein
MKENSVRQYSGAVIILVAKVFPFIPAFRSFLLYGCSSIPIVPALWLFQLSDGADEPLRHAIPIVKVIAYLLSFSNLKRK